MSRSLKVGIFVLIGIVLAGVATFLIGDTEQLWNRKVEYTAAFADVSGLKPGSPVSMGGVDVGRVGTVVHAAEVGDRKIYVKLQIDRIEPGGRFVVENDLRMQSERAGESDPLPHAAGEI